MKILRGFGLLFVALWVIGALLSLFTSILPHPRDLPLPMMALVSVPLFAYFAAEMLSVFFEAIGLTKRGARGENPMPDDSLDKKPHPRS